MIAVLDYGIGNLRSAEKALLHLGGDARLVTRAEDALGATGVVLPGVGAFGACARALRDSGLDAVARDAIGSDLPFLGICIGFQLLFSGSEESPGVPGLGLLPGHVARLASIEKLPQMQWNVIERRRGNDAMFAGLDERPWFYFVHSYAPVLPAEQRHLVAATCDYGEEVVAATTSGRCWGTQFHPEKSGRSGMSVLGAFVDLCASTARWA